MKVVKIWSSPEAGKRSHYAWYVLGGITGVVLLAMLLICGGVTLMFYNNWPRELFLLLLCIGVTALAVYLAACLGRRTVQEATVFFLTEGDQLFAMDARRLVHHGHSMLDFAIGTVQTQQFLRQIGSCEYPPAGADLVVKVERIRANRSHYAVVCRIQHPDRHIVWRTYFLMKGMEGEELLLRQLERRRSWDSALGASEDRSPLYILVSALVCAGLTALCVLSHPVIAKLPQVIYFPCLGATFIVFCCAIYLVIRYRREE